MINQEIVLYHGTDIYSGLDILNNGLNADKLKAKQIKFVQLGLGFYTTPELEVAKFFGSLAVTSPVIQFTVIEMSLPNIVLAELLLTGQARREKIVNVHFMAEQIWFNITCFDRLNEQAEFKPYREK